MVRDLWRRRRQQPGRLKLRGRHAVNHGRRGEHQPNRQCSDERDRRNPDRALIDLGVAGGGAGPTGMIAFTVFGPQTTAPTICASGGTVVDRTSVSGNGTYNPSASFTPMTAGTYWWYATYGGDSNNLASTSTCGSGMPSTTVGGASTNLTANASASGTAGTQIAPSSISATLAGGVDPTGTITFTVFGPQTDAPADCSNGGTVVDTTSVSGNGTYNPSVAFTPTTAGSYWWYSTYGGDANNNPTASSCGAGMPSTTVKNATGFDRVGPRDGTAGTAITAGSLQLEPIGSDERSRRRDHLHRIRTTDERANGLLKRRHRRRHDELSGDEPTTRAQASHQRPQAGLVVFEYTGDGNNSPTASSCGAGMPSTTVSAASTNLTATAPATGTAGTQITASSISASLTGGSGPTGTSPSPYSDHRAWRQRIVQTAAGPSDTTAFPATEPITPRSVHANDLRHLLVDATYGGDSNNLASTSTCGSGMPSTTVDSATTSLTATAPASGTAGPGHGVIDVVIARGRLRPDRHDHLHRIRAAGERTDDLRQRRPASAPRAFR